MTTRLQETAAERVEHRFIQAGAVAEAAGVVTVLVVIGIALVTDRNEVLHAHEAHSLRPVLREVRLMQ
jgi:hypothetical protein